MDTSPMGATLSFISPSQDLCPQWEATCSSRAGELSWTSIKDGVRAWMHKIGQNGHQGGRLFFASRGQAFLTPFGLYCGRIC